MRTLKLLTILLLLLPICAFSTDYLTIVEIDRGEKWWGVYVDNSPMQPFVEPFSVSKTNIYGNGGDYTVPMLISSTGRYIWSSVPMKVEFTPRSLKVTAQGQKASVVKAGRNLREAYLVCIHKNNPPSGNIPMLEFFTNPVYETYDDTGYALSQNEIIAYAERLVKENFNPGIMVVGEGWRASGGAYEFDREYYPDPKGMVAKLHSLGFKVMLTVTPFTTASGRRFVSYAESSYLLRDSDGNPSVVRCNNGYNVCLDVGLPQAAAILREKIGALRENYDIDGFRFDARALMPLLTDVSRRDRFMKGWSELGKGINLCEYLPCSDKQMTPSISCVMFNGGDLDRSLNDVLSAGLVGYPYLHPVYELSGGVQMVSKFQQDMGTMLELSAFMPVMGVPVAPWRISDEKMFQRIKDVFAFRASISQYIETMVRESARTAEPLIRTMEYQYPRMGFADCRDQFMLGDKYLIVLNSGDQTKKMVRLPRGIWVNSKGQKFKGPLVINVDISDGRVVYFQSTIK